MIVVNINRSYGQVLSGDLELKDATRGEWAGMTDMAISHYGDVLIGVWRDRVVSAYDITGHTRVDGGVRVVFEVEVSPRRLRSQKACDQCVGACARTGNDTHSGTSDTHDTL